MLQNIRWISCRHNRNFHNFFSSDSGPIRCLKFGYDSLGNDLSEIPLRAATDPQKCQELCMEEPTCNFFAFNSRNDPPQNNGCWLKKDIGTPTQRANVVIGAKDCEGISTVLLEY